MRLDQMVNMNHELIILSKEVDWNWIENELKDSYSEEGRPSIPIRTMVGMLLLKQLYNQSDESVLARWVENPYWQYFTGEQYFQHKPPFDSTDFVYFRKRVGEAGMEKVLSLTVRLHSGSEAEEEVQVDTTVQEKNITFPTDSKLAFKIIKYCWSYAKAERVDLRQSYRFVVKGLRMKLHNGGHPRRQKAARKASRKLKTIAGRLVRDLLRKLDAEALAYYGPSLNLFEQVLAQKKSSKNKRYSLHEPAVWCIAKGKPHKKYEFGCKVSVARNAKSGVIVGMKSFTGNPYDGDTLEASLDQIERIRRNAGGDRPKIAVADRGYRGRKEIGQTKILIPTSGSKSQTNYEKQKQRKRFRKRAGIEPVIGHLKEDHRMRRNFLSREIGDAVNCLLAGAAFNLKMRLNQIRSSFWAFFRDLWASMCWEIAVYGHILATCNQMRSNFHKIHS
ncbi:MAG: IS5 family transposase [Saprospiraceae bacterium]|nr:IS5 family transposase [Saprospiraceae bacterium]